MKYLKYFKESTELESECKWCYKKFTPNEELKDFCCIHCESKYNNYLGNDNSKSPWDKYID